MQIQGTVYSLVATYPFRLQPTLATGATKLAFYKVLMAIVVPIIAWMVFLLYWDNISWTKGQENLILVCCRVLYNVRLPFKLNALGSKSLCNAALVSHCLRDSSLMLNARSFLTSETDPERMKIINYLFTPSSLCLLFLVFSHPGISAVCISCTEWTPCVGILLAMIVLDGVCLQKIARHTFSDTFAKNSLVCSVSTFCFMHLLETL